MSESSTAGGGLSHPIVPVLVGLVLIVGGGYLYYSGMQATANAEEVDATVVDSAVVDNTDPTDSNEPAEFTVRIEYEYTYEGETYTSENLCPGAGSGCEPSSDFRTDMQEYLEEYPEGETVTAYVPPSDPAGAYLIDTGPSPIYLGIAAVGLLLVLLGGRRVASEGV